MTEPNDAAMTDKSEFAKALAEPERLARDLNAIPVIRHLDGDTYTAWINGAWHKVVDGRVVKG